MARRPTPDPNRPPRNRLGVMLFLTHAAVAGLLLATVPDRPVPPQRLWLWSAAAGAAGLLLTWPVLVSVRRLTDAVARMPNQPGWRPLRALWPLRDLLTRFNRLGDEVESIRTMREQLTDQIRETAAQEERNRLARELHDSVKQQIFLMNVSAATAQARWDSDPDGARRALEDVREASRQALAEMQAMLQQIRPQPLNVVSLVGALREQCQALEYRSGATVVVEIGRLPPDDLLPLGAVDNLFRIAQEALANIGKHARAGSVGVWLRSESDGDQSFLTLRVVDDGQGFAGAPEDGGMGLRNIRDRATEVGATVDLTSRPGAGTDLTVRVPLLTPPPSRLSVLAPAGMTAADLRPAVNARRYLLLYLTPVLLTLTTGNFALGIGLLFVLYDFVTWRGTARRLAGLADASAEARAWLVRWSRRRAWLYLLALVGMGLVAAVGWWQPAGWSLAANGVLLAALGLAEWQTALDRDGSGGVDSAESPPFQRLVDAAPLPLWSLIVAVAAAYVVTAVRAAQGSIAAWLQTAPVPKVLLLVVLIGAAMQCAIYVLSQRQIAERSARADALGAARG